MCTDDPGGKTDEWDVTQWGEDGQFKVKWFTLKFSMDTDASVRPNHKQDMETTVSYVEGYLLVPKSARKNCSWITKIEFELCERT